MSDLEYQINKLTEILKTTTSVSYICHTKDTFNYMSITYKYV